MVEEGWKDFISTTWLDGTWILNKEEFIQEWVDKGIFELGPETNLTVKNGYYIDMGTYDAWQANKYALRMYLDESKKLFTFKSWVDPDATEYHIDVPSLGPGGFMLQGLHVIGSPTEIPEGSDIQVYKASDDFCYYQYTVGGEAPYECTYTPYKMTQKIRFNAPWRSITLAMFNEDCTLLSNWDLSAVYDFSWLFDDCLIHSLDGLEAWDVSHVTSFLACFQRCTNLKDISAIADWHVSPNTNIEAMFEEDYNIVNAKVIDSWADNWTEETRPEGSAYYASSGATFYVVPEPLPYWWNNEIKPKPKSREKVLPKYSIIDNAPKSSIYG